MGWLFSERWLKRKDLIEHLVNGNGVKTLKHCCVGNHLWCVHETKYGHNTIRYICLYMMQGPTRRKDYDGRDKDWWGYKDVDESMGPCATSCPESYLTFCTAPENQWAYEWRQRIYAKHAARRARPKIVVGMKLQYGGQVYKVTECLGNRGYQVDGCYRLKRAQANAALILEN